ncbi:uncharacterized protein LOC110254459 [Exaiptasia diaphana]|uniref:Uncharacterized protein n=1 Tax=Exaiptasia diaphana TaxID=2652724 RepID=A0A913YBC7_EXADI|nr:uncharacterized protein LOC110254459 [Exaiptasia diaphana]KXJ21182.1 hypothetical protein AC249_AIPGENE1505 [Exaiptasia diaphana]
MGFLKSIFYILVSVSVYYTLNNFHEVSTNVSRAVNHVLPQILNMLTVTVATVRDYCTHDMAKDVNKCITFISTSAQRVLGVLTPLGKGFGNGVVHLMVSVHDNAMSYTEDGLNQILGIEDSLVLQQVPQSRYKLLSLILLVFWIFSGIVTFSRISYNKFFLVMSSSFLLHSVFGPVWCMRRLAFVIGLCMWMGSLIADKPIVAAITVLVLFLLTGLRKWRKRLQRVKSAEDLVKFNKTMEQRIDGIEKKLDMILAKMDFFVDKSNCNDRKRCTRA